MRVRVYSGWGVGRERRSVLNYVLGYMHARAVVCAHARGGHTAAVARAEFSRSRDLGKCHSAHGGGSPVTHKAVAV